MEVGDALTGEGQPSCLDRILMGDDDHIPVGVIPIQSSCDFRQTLGNLHQLLIHELQTFRVLEIGLELARETLRNRIPRVSAPSFHERPIGEVRVDANRDSGAGCDLFGCAESALLWGGPDSDHGSRAEIAADPAGLLEPVR